MASLAVRPKGPQPVLDNLIGAPDSTLKDDLVQRNLYPPIGLNLQLLPDTNGLSRTPVPAANGNANGVVLGRPSPGPDDRPKLLRSKSDFGPRRETDSENAETDSKASAETEWGIRHGFDTQLVSEEYNNLLTSVRCLLI